MSMTRKVNRAARKMRGTAPPGAETAIRTSASAPHASKASTVQDVPSKNAQRTRRQAAGMRASMNRAQSRGSSR
jgi:hypothetical protein